MLCVPQRSLNTPMVRVGGGVSVKVGGAVSAGAGPSSLEIRRSRGV